MYRALFYILPMEWLDNFLFPLPCSPDASNFPSVLCYPYSCYHWLQVYCIIIILITIIIIILSIVSNKSNSWSYLLCFSWISMISKRSGFVRDFHSCVPHCSIYSFSFVLWQPWDVWKGTWDLSSNYSFLTGTVWLTTPKVMLGNDCT